MSQFAGILACIFLISFTGKRPLAFASALGSSLLFGSAGFCGYFYLGLEDIDDGAHVQEEFDGSPKFAWFPTVCFIGGSLFSYVGVKILPWVLIGEVYPTNIRGLASGLSTSLGYLLSFLSNKTFFNLISLFTLPGVFVLYGIIGIASLAVFYKYLPETEGWALTEVEEHFSGYRNLIKAGRKKTRNTADSHHMDNPMTVNDEVQPYRYILGDNHPTQFLFHVLSIYCGNEPSEVAGLEDAEARKRRIRCILAQVLAASGKNTIFFAYGLLIGFPTIVIPSVYNAPENATLILTQEEVSWFGSTIFVTNPLGCVFSGFLSNTFGRRRSMQVLTIPILITWLIFYFANSAAMLLAGVALAGFTGGLLEAPVITYISEITEPRFRGMLSATSTLTIMLGMFAQYWLGSVCDWRILSLIYLVVPFLVFAVLCFIPESPHWLLSKNRFEDSKKSLRWLRGWTTQEHIQEEYDQLVKDLRLQGDECHTESANRCCSSDLTIFLKRTFIFPFLLVMFTALVVHFSGTTALTTYAVPIFNSYGAPINGYFATVILGGARILGGVTSVACIHYTGKRPLVFASLAGVGITTGIAGFYGYVYLELVDMDNGAHINEHFDGMPAYSWLPMTCFILVPFCGYVAVLILPWLLIGEVYPTEIRSFMTGISCGLCYLIGFVVTKIFFDLVNALTLPGVFILNAVVAFTSIIIFYYWLPETEGWSLTEVQEHFAGKRNLIKAGIKKKGDSERHSCAD